MFTPGSRSNFSINSCFALCGAGSYSNMSWPEQSASNYAVSTLRVYNTSQLVMVKCRAQSTSLLSFFCKEWQKYVPKHSWPATVSCYIRITIHTSIVDTQTHPIHMYMEWMEGSGSGHGSQQMICNPEQLSIPTLNINLHMQLHFLWCALCLGLRTGLIW